MLCTITETCCGTMCVDLKNDPEHCGDCQTKCDPSKPLCADGMCQVPPCAGQACGSTQLCCGAQCCDKSQICCVSNPLSEPYCYTPTSTQGSCPP